MANITEKTQNKAVKSSGAGYAVNKKAWKEAANRGLEKRIAERLRIFGRPVSLAQICDRILVDCPDSYTENDIKQALDRLTEAGMIRVEKNGYTIIQRENKT